MIAIGSSIESINSNGGGENMAKTLELSFVNEEEGITRISIENPKEPVELEKLKTAMQEIVAANAVASKSGSLTSIKGAKLVERNVTDYDLM